MWRHSWDEGVRVLLDLVAELLTQVLQSWVALGSRLPPTQEPWATLGVYHLVAVHRSRASHAVGCHCSQPRCPLQEPLAACANVVATFVFPYTVLS